MKYKYEGRENDNSSVRVYHYDGYPPGIGVFKDGFAISEMHLPKPTCKHFPMTAAHELGHVLTAHQFEHLETHQGTNRIRYEHVSWQVAKTILKPELWDEEYALDCLNRYVHTPHHNHQNEIKEFTEI